MSETPHDIRFALSDFDRKELPKAQQELQGDEYVQAVQGHLAEQFTGEGGIADVTVREGLVSIRWKESTDGLLAKEQGINQLKEGHYTKGIAILRRVLEQAPEDPEALFNLGIALGDCQDHSESVALLEKLIEIEPTYPGALLALGVAYARRGDWAQAIANFRSAVMQDPQDGLARKNLGAALSQTGQLEVASEHLKAAVVLLPSDPEAWLNLGMHMEQTEEKRDAALAYRRVIEFAPGSQLSEKAEQGINRITTASFRAEGRELNSEAVHFCTQALRQFGGLPEAEVRKIVFEIAALGAQGLSVGDPAAKYSLQSLPGKFSGLHLLCLQYVGFQSVDPLADIGFDVAAEYQRAKELL